MTLGPLRFQRIRRGKKDTRDNVHAMSLHLALGNDNHKARRSSIEEASTSHGNLQPKLFSATHQVIPAFLEKQGSQNIGQSLRVDDAQGFGQRRMTRRRPAYKAEFRLLTPLRLRPRRKAAFIPRRPHKSDTTIRLRIDHSM